MTTIILKNDQILGKFACVEESEAEGLRAYLVESRIPFALDAERVARLAGPGKRTFVFGASHPHQLREILADCGPPVEVAEGMTLSENSYRPPVDRLLQLGET